MKNAWPLSKKENNEDKTENRWLSSLILCGDSYALFLFFGYSPL